MDRNECPHCHKDRAQYIACCDAGVRDMVVAAKDTGGAKRKKRTRVISADVLDSALMMLIADGSVEVVDPGKMDNEVRYRLTKKGELLAQAVGKPPYGDA